MSTIRQVLVILASSSETTDSAELSTLMCKEFMKECQQHDIAIDLIDLDNETEFQPFQNKDEHQTKILEYQLRIKRADYIAIFHPTVFFHLPGLLKLFIDEVFISGFAYTRYRGIVKGLLGNKNMLVCAVSDSSAWQVSLLDNSGLQTFWKRSLAKNAALNVQFNLIGSAREKMHKEKEKMLAYTRKMVAKLNPSKPLDSIEMF